MVTRARIVKIFRFAQGSFSHTHGAELVLPSRSAARNSRRKEPLLGGPTGTTLVHIMNLNFHDATAVATAVFPAHPAATLQARHMVSRLMTELVEDPELRADAELTVSELVTNAARAATPDVTVTIAASAREVHIEVTDQDVNHVPLLDSPESDAEHGRGMMIVQQLSSRSGCDVDSRGKHVWADLDSHPDETLLRPLSLPVVALASDDITAAGPAASADSR